MHRFQSVTDRSLTRRRVLRSAAVVGVLLLVATVLDPIVFRLFAHEVVTPEGSSLRAVREAEGSDWYRLLRVMGSYWTWLAVAGVLLIHDMRTPMSAPRLLRGGRDTTHRAGSIVVIVAAAGLLAELLKLIIVRERPVTGLDYQGFVFGPLLGGFTGHGNIGFPSSHTSAAFGGAAAMGMLFPAARPALFLLAAGCGFSRILVGAHWFSDVVGGAACGIAAAAWLYPRLSAGLVRRPTEPARIG